MHIRSLTHLLDAVRALARPRRIVVLGSASLLGTDPRLGEPGQPLELSYDAELLLHPVDDETARILHEAVGEGSLFHRRHACFADILRPEIVKTLPEGWEPRLVRLPDPPDVSCLDPHDLALVKLALGREKDMALLKQLLERGVIRGDELRRRFHALAWDEDRINRTGRNLGRLVQPGS